MSQLFYDAAPNATRVSPEREADRHYPEKPEAVTLFGTCVVDLFPTTSSGELLRDDYCRLTHS